MKLIKLSVFLLCLLMYTINCFGQHKDFDIKLGKSNDFGKDSGWWKLDCFTNDSEEIFVLKSRFLLLKNGEFFIEKFDKDLKKVQSKEVNLSFNGKRHILENLLLTDNVLYMITSYHNKKDNKRIVYAHELNKQSLKTIGKPRELFDFYYTNPFKLRNDKMGDRVQYIWSEDKKYLVLGYNVEDEGTKEDKYFLSVWNDKMEKQWEKTIALDYKPFYPRFEGNDPYIQRGGGGEGAMIDNDGNIYLKRYVHEKKPKKVKDNFRVELTCIQDKGEKIIEFIPASNIHDMDYILKNNVLYGLGVTAEVKEEIDGVYSVVFNKKDLSIEQETRDGFSKDLVNEVSQQAKKFLKSGADIDYYIKENGEKTVIIEKVDQITANSRGTMELLVLNLNEKGKIVNENVVWKKQVMPSDMEYVLTLRPNLLSYQLLEREGDLYFVFNDHPKNLNVQNPKSLKKGYFDNSSIFCVKIDKEGKQSKSILSGGIGTSLVLAGLNKKEHPNLIFLTYGTRRKKSIRDYQLGRIEF